jgi:hypothetical protein
MNDTYIVTTNVVIDDILNGHGFVMTAGPLERQRKY